MQYLCGPQKSNVLRGTVVGAGAFAICGTINCKLFEQEGSLASHNYHRTVAYSVAAFTAPIIEQVVRVAQREMIYSGQKLLKVHKYSLMHRTPVAAEMVHFNYL